MRGALMAALFVMLALSTVEGASPAHGEALVHSLDDSDVGASKELAAAKLRTPVNHVLKSQLPDGPKPKKFVPKKHSLPSQKTMKAAALAHATNFRAKTAKMAAKENLQKVAGITSRERARKATQPRPPTQGIVKLKVTAANEAKKKQERSVKRNNASEKQRKQAEFERGGANKKKPKPAAQKPDERRMKASEARMKASEKKLKASERRVKQTPRKVKVVKKVVHVHDRKPRKGPSEAEQKRRRHHKNNKHHHKLPAGPSEAEQKRRLDTRANHHVAHEKAKKHEAKQKEKVQKSKAKHAKHVKKHHKAAGKVKEITEKSTMKPGAFAKANAHLRQLRKGASSRVHAATHPDVPSAPKADALGENRADAIEEKLKGIEAEAPGSKPASEHKQHHKRASVRHSAPSGSKAERSELISAAHSIAGTPAGKARRAAKKSLKLVAHDMAAREHGRLNAKDSLKGLKKDENVLINAAKRSKNADPRAKKGLMVAAKMVSQEEKKERMQVRLDDRKVSTAMSSHRRPSHGHKARMPAERSKLIEEAKAVGRAPESPGKASAKKAIKLVANDMVKREHGTLNTQASLRSLKKDESEILNVARKEARVEHGAKRAAAKKVLLVAANAVSAEERKERAPREKRSHRQPKKRQVHHKARKAEPAERSKLLVEAKEVARAPRSSARSSAKKAIKLVANDMVAREHGTLNKKASLQGLKKDESELLNVAKKEAKVEHGAARAASKKALMVAAKAVTAEEKKEGAVKETAKAAPAPKVKVAAKPKAKAVKAPKPKAVKAPKPKAKVKVAAKPKAKAVKAPKPKAKKSFIKRFGDEALGKDLKSLSSKADQFINKEVAHETASTKKDVTILQKDAASFEQKIEKSAALKMKMKELERKDKRVVKKEKRMASALVNKAMGGKHLGEEAVVPFN